jgi:hypothetical protein
VLGINRHFSENFREVYELDFGRVHECASSKD